MRHLFIWACAFGVGCVLAHYGIYVCDWRFWAIAVPAAFAVCWIAEFIP